MNALSSSTGTGSVPASKFFKMQYLYGTVLYQFLKVQYCMLPCLSYIFTIESQLEEYLMIFIHQKMFKKSK